MQDSLGPQALRLTRLIRPRVTGRVIHRPDLTARLDEGVSRPLTLVSAPAGFGKTTLLVDWLAARDHPAAWLSLDNSETDLPSFVTYMIAALHTLFPGACATALALTRTLEAVAAQTLAAALGNDLERLAAQSPEGIAPYILVLDDYHLAESRSTDDFLFTLLQHPPTGLHLVLSTRRDPALPLNQMRAGGRLTDIRATDLRFDATQIGAFMENALGQSLGPAEIGILAERTEGWAAALQLAALALRGSEDVERRLAALQGENRYISAYLLDDVLADLPDPVEEFLLKTAVLDRLTGPLCDAVLGDQGSEAPGAATLAWLETAGLFTFALDAQGRWYRYHHLLQTLLLNRLACEYSPDDIAALHRRASDWYAANGFVDAAITHALAAGDHAAVVALIAAHRHSAMNDERWLDLQRWLGLLPHELRNAYAETVLAEAWLLHHRARREALTPVLARAGALLQEYLPDDGAKAAMQGEIDALLAVAAYWQTDAGRALALARKALAQTPREHFYVQGIAQMFAAAALQMKGDAERAIEWLRQGEGERPIAGHEAATRTHTSLGFIYWAIADLPSLLQTAGRLYALGGAHDLPETLAFAHYFEGCARYQQDDLAGAARAFGAVAAEDGRAHGNVFVYAAYGLAAVHQALGRREQARAVVEPVLRYALEVDNRGIYASGAAFMAHLAVLQGREEEASQWAAQAGRTVRPTAMPLFYAPAFTLPEVLLAQRTPQSLAEADAVLEQLLAHVQAIHNTRFTIEALALRALVHDARGETRLALAAARAALAYAEPGGVIRVFADLGPRMAGLLTQLRAETGATGFINRVLAAFAPIAALPPPHSQPALIEPLTDRELEVLVLLGRRYSNKEIAGELVISPLTVKRHTSNIYQKLAVNSRREAIARAAALGIVAPASP